MIGFSFLITKVSILSGSHKEGRDAEKQYVCVDFQLLPSNCLQSIHDEGRVTIMETGNVLAHLDDFFSPLFHFTFLFF